MDKLEVLKRSDLFRELDNKQLKLVAKRSTAEVCEPGAIIYRQNTMLDRLYVIEYGLVGIIIEPCLLSQRQIQPATKFESFGWEAVITPHMTIATAKAIETTKILILSWLELFDLSYANPRLGCKIYQGIVGVLVHRLHTAYVQCLGLTAQD